MALQGKEDFCPWRCDEEQHLRRLEKRRNLFHS